MKNQKLVRFLINVVFTDKGEVQPLQAYAFTSGGKLIGNAPVEKNVAIIEIPSDLDGRTIEVILGPRLEKEQPMPTAAGFKRLGAYARPSRFLVKSPSVEFKIPSVIFPLWCLCVVRGRLIKRVTLPDGTMAEWPVCNARVHICEVDRVRLIIPKLPDLDILRLRDDLLRKLELFPKPPIPWPWPGPDPIIRRRMAVANITEARTTELTTNTQQAAISSLRASDSIPQLRKQLSDLSSIIAVYLCDLIYLWPFFRVDCLSVVDADETGYFNSLIAYDCADRPDIYFWVEQFQDGVWQTVYRPSIGCGTHWNYTCGTEIVINLPRAVGCQSPPYDVPDGVTLFVLPYSIGFAPIWGIPPGLPTPVAPDGWVRSDGYINYQTNSTYGSDLGWLFNAPFGGTLHFYHDDSYFIPSSNIKYYRYSYRRIGSSDDWTLITTPLARGYRMEYTDRLPTYEAYPVGPVTIGTQSGLFEFKPIVPPARATDPATVVAREWTSGNLSEVAASWNTTGAAPPLGPDNSTDDAGDFDVKIEVFDPSGNQVLPGPTTFRFLVRNADGTTTRLATPAEESSAAYILRVHIDNNFVAGALPQPSIGGIAASDDCGFLRYEAGDLVHIQFNASHPNNHAVFSFQIKRGSNRLDSASTPFPYTSPYVEVAALSAPTGSSPYTKSAGDYQRDFAPSELVGTCLNAAFAANLNVWGKVTDGYYRLYSNFTYSDYIAFALAEQESPPEE